MRAQNLVALLIALGLLGCSSSQSADKAADDQAAQAEQAVDEKAAETEQNLEGLADWEPIYAQDTPVEAPWVQLEDDFRIYYNQRVIPPNIATTQKVGYFDDLLGQKSAAQRRIEKGYIDALEAEEPPTDKIAYVAFRIGHTYVDFACQLQNILIPEDLEAADAQLYRDNVNSNVSAMFIKARGFFEQASAEDSQPWAAKAGDLTTDIPAIPAQITTDRAAEICTEHRKMWASPMDLAQANQTLAEAPQPD